MWLYNLVSHKKIKFHCLHFSDFPPEWQPCADTNCSNKILQSYKSYKGQSTFDTSQCISNQFLSHHTEKIYTSPKFKLLKCKGGISNMYFFSGGPEPPLIYFDIFFRENMCSPEEITAPPLRKKSAPLKIQSARKFTAAHPKCYMGRRVQDQ